MKALITLFIISCIFLNSIVSGGPIIGIDLGTSNMIISLAKPGSIDIVLGEETSRKTPSVLAFNDGRRLFGDQALNLVCI